VEDGAEIRRLHRAEEMPIKAIARMLGVSRNTVRAALASGGPPKYERKPARVGRGCSRALPAPDYYDGSAPPGPFSGRCAYPGQRAGCPPPGTATGRFPGSP
jgi:Sigma-70, region 4